MGDDLHLLFCEALAKADRSIYLEMYSITDGSIISVVKNQALQGKKVEILADKSASPLLKKKIGPLAFPSIDSFYLHKGPGLMHRKIVVIDEELVLLGSTNFTKSSLNMHDNLVVAICDSSLAQFCQNRSPPWSYSNDQIRIWKLPETGKEALDTLRSLLSSAKKTIRVAMFTFSHKELAKELIDAHARGIDVQVALDHYTREGSSKEIADLLLAHGIPLLISQGAHLLHHKWVLIDGKTLVTGSANWTKSAFKKNKDLLFVIDPLDTTQKHAMKRIWQAVKTESLP